MPTIKTSLLCLTISLFLIGCAAAGAIATAVNLAKTAMEITGINKKELPDAQKVAREVKIEITASKQLNTTPSGESLALVTRFYKLKQNTAFEHATYETFMNPEAEKLAFGSDLLAVTETVLVPGQHYVAIEKVSAEAPFIGVVALFRAPNSKHWRATFSSAAAGDLGINVSMLACVMLVNSGDAQTQRKNKALSSSKCY